MARTPSHRRATRALAPSARSPSPPSPSPRAAAAEEATPAPPTEKARPSPSGTTRETTAPWRRPETPPCRSSKKRTGATVKIEEKSFEQIQKTASQVLDTDARPRPHGVQQGQRDGRLPRQHRPDRRHQRRPSRITGGTRSSPPRCRPRRSTPPTASWAATPGTACRTTASSSASTTTLDAFKAAGLELPTTYDDFVKVLDAFVAKGVTPLAEGRRRVPARPALVPARAEQGRPLVGRRLPAVQEPVDWNGSEVDYASKTLTATYVSKGYIAKDVSSVKAKTRVCLHQRHLAHLRFGARGGTAASPRKPFSTGRSRRSPDRSCRPARRATCGSCPSARRTKNLAYEFIDVTMSPEIQAIIGNSVAESGRGRHRRHLTDAKSKQAHRHLQRRARRRRAVVLTPTGPRPASTTCSCRSCRDS